MARKKHFLAGLGGMLIFLYFFGGSLLDALENLANISVPNWAYGLLSLGFLVGFTISYFRDKGGGGRGK